MARERGVYQPSQFATEGFIHCSYLSQLLPVANRFFRGQNNLVVLVIDTTQIKSKIVEENLEGGGELYPHIYSLLPIDAVREIIKFSSNTDGSFALPKELQS